MALVSPATLMAQLPHQLARLDYYPRTPMFPWLSFGINTGISRTLVPYAPQRKVLKCQVTYLRIEAFQTNIPFPHTEELDLIDFFEHVFKY